MGKKRSLNTKPDFEWFQENLPKTFSGFEFEWQDGSWSENSPEEREAVLERIWENGSLRALVVLFQRNFL